MKTRTWRYYTQRGYSLRKAYSDISGAHIEVYYCHEQAGENPQTILLERLHIPRWPSEAQQRQYLRRCAEIAAAHMTVQQAADKERETLS